MKYLMGGVDQSFELEVVDQRTKEQTIPDDYSLYLSPNLLNPHDFATKIHLCMTGTSVT